MTNETKKKLGQFYTTNYDYILQNMYIPENIECVIEPKLCIDKQKILVDKFNKYLNEKREKYNSLFLTNYRESKRKRIYHLI